MRSFQKKLTAAAASAALLAALGAAFAQSSDPLDAHSATADRNANVSQGTQVRHIDGNDLSTNGPMPKQTSTSQATDNSSLSSQSSSTTQSTTTAPTDQSSSSSSTTTDNSSASATTDNSAAAAPRADRN